MHGQSLNLRQDALQKIASLSASAKTKRGVQSSTQKLFDSLQVNTPSQAVSNGTNGAPEAATSLAKMPMALEELHVLLALCKAAPAIDNLQRAQELLDRIGIYMLEAPAQTIAPSPFLSSVEPSPWEALSFCLVDACLALGLKQPTLHDQILDLILKYMDRCKIIAQGIFEKDSNNIPHASTVRGTNEVLVLALSVLGFLQASTDKFYFFTAEESLSTVQFLRELLSEQFMTAVEGALSSVRNADPSIRSLKEFKVFLRRYSDIGRPLSAMLLQRAFLRLMVSCSSLELTSFRDLQQASVLDYLLSKRHPQLSPIREQHFHLIEVLSEIAADAIRLLDDGADYLELESIWQRHLAFQARSYALTTFLACMIVNEDIADIDLLMVWLENSIADNSQMADEGLACTVLKSFAVIAKTSPAIASSLTHSLPRFIVQGDIQGPTIIVAAQCLTSILQTLSQDAIITGIYSLGNVLSAGNVDKGIAASMSANGSLPSKDSRYTQHSVGSAISVEASGDEETSVVYVNVVRTIVTITNNCADEKITSLALSMLLQKLGRVSLNVDLAIITETASLGLISGTNDLKSLLKLYDRLAHDATAKNNSVLIEALMQAHVQLAEGISRDSTSYQIYLLHLLETIVSKGDIHEGQNTHMADVELASKEIAQLLKPLALLAPSIAQYGNVVENESTGPLQREVWFNIAVHGIIPGSVLWENNLEALRELARYSKPLIAEDRTNHLESDIELNTVLRRGMNGPRIVEVKKSLQKLLPSQETHIRSLPYPKVIFLHAAYSLETLRAFTGSCADVLTYFTDPAVNQDGTALCMSTIANEALSTYLSRTLKGLRPNSIAPYVAKELAKILASCCHRIQKAQDTAISFADRIVSQVPAALCQRASLFAVLELLTLMWMSCLEEEIQEYEWKSSYTSTITDLCLELSDDFPYRRRTLTRFQSHARSWVMKVINVAPLDTKGLLQTYLSEYDDDGAYGHVSLGRSFALEIGSAIPITNHKLDAINRQDESNINTGSDFIAQYTTRQEYKYAEALPEYDKDWQNLLQMGDHKEDAMNKFDEDITDSVAILSVLERRLIEGKFVPISEVRDILRRAAALLCRSRKDQSAIIRQLVRIPFILLSKQSIKLGVSVWLGVINENPRMETRTLTEIMTCWEESVRKGQGIFDPKLIHLDPFYVKEEFAPSDKTVLIKRQQAVHNLISPHLRILQFLVSHFSASRLGSPHLRRSVHRLISITLNGLRSSAGHPLLREFYFEIILFGLQMLKLSNDLGKAAKWRLKDRILSAALNWFSHPPRWTFGGNRLQVKAECDLIGDVESALLPVSDIGAAATDTLPTLSVRQDLLKRLLEHEKARLQVWLFPLNRDSKHVQSDKASLVSIPPSSLAAAWAENPSLAIQIASRAQTPLLLREVRNLILSQPFRTLEDPDALHILLEEGLPKDVSSQLRYLLYWVPVNPITATTYFLPTFGNNSFVIQYAMRALESHSVDVTFFYVPQIVQTLRYDALGYVQRYIVETAKFSQIFAHQIIWNMKANAYKDEDATIEDSIKPKLDEVMNNMIESFSGTDKDFYEREFAFFNEVTDISGKLRPYIKKEKSEKKQKIEEELRKINVEVGVYLPSNPDGVVVGIDRKSGKPLQSHAKAPFMATFRIRKNRGDMEGTDNLLEDVNKQREASGNPDPRSNASAVATTEGTYEVWQSAIFKVGDDCRQDVLALQMIACFRGIFNSVGLDVFVYPYRVTATAPGCGVIDVLPNSISRDMLGREAVNGLYEYFVSKYGGEDSIRFQEARQNFVKSMAAYSVISYLLQFKDRHNGNIMVDDAGHILHIDFGFCFDIAPGGVKFERAPFKLTGEMVAVMGGSTGSQSFRWFEELCVKAFLASRPYTEKLAHMIRLMMDSGLPCFKPETIAHFRERMVLEKSEREAAEFMQMLVRRSYGSNSTKTYDYFQLLTNGIPY